MSHRKSMKIRENLSKREPAGFMKIVKNQMKNNVFLIFWSSEGATELKGSILIDF